MSAQRWYVMADGNVGGPFDESAIETVILRGELSSARIRPETSEVWQDLHTHPRFRDALIAVGAIVPSAPVSARAKVAPVPISPVAPSPPPMLTGLQKFALAGFVFFGLFVWHTCSAWSDEYDRKQAAEEAQHRADEARAAADEARYESQQAAEKRAEEAKARKDRADHIAQLAALSPTQRVVKLQNCHRDGSGCEAPAELLFAAAATDAERGRLKNLDDSMTKAENLRDRMNSRAILCGDGTESDSCTCGGSHRGCCSHHGGVAGCAPLGQ